MSTQKDATRTQSERSLCAMCGYPEKDNDAHVGVSHYPFSGVLSALDMAKKLAGGRQGIDPWAKVLQEWLDSYVNRWKQKEEVWQSAYSAGQASKDAEKESIVLFNEELQDKLAATSEREKRLLDSLRDAGAAIGDYAAMSNAPWAVNAAQAIKAALAEGK